MNRTAWLLTLLLLLAAETASSAAPQIVAVFDIENSGAKLGKVALERLNTYLTTKIAGMGYQVVPRAELRKRLRAQRAESYKACYDQSCQIEIGRELAAQKSVSTKILRLGSKCVVTMALYDLRKSATERAGDATGDCGIGGLVRSIEAAAQKLAPAVVAPGMVGRYKVKGVVDRKRCPAKGTLRQGDPPPKGTYAWCVDAKTGIRNGWSANWHTNGKLAMTGPYRDNKQHGLWTIYHRNGKKYSEVLYRDGHKQGPTTEWDDKGNKIQAGHYKNGQKVGVWTRWVKGMIYSKTTYKNDDQNGRYVEFDLGQQGAKRLEGFYRDGQKDGTWIEYRGGVVHQRGLYKANEKHGVWKRYQRDEEQVTTYRAGKRHGPFERRRAGQLVAKGFYNNDRKHGSWTEYRSRTVTTETYRDGKRHGPYLKRRDGQLVLKGQYRDNYRHGTWIHYRTDGKAVREVVHEEGRVVSSRSLR